jgi:2-methylfumaryl-CoA isomerase
MIAKLMDVDLDEEGGRFTAREAIAATLKPWVLQRTLEDPREDLDGTGVAWGPYQMFTELVEKPRASSENPMFEEVEQPGIGTYRMPRSPLELSNAKRLSPARAPVVGEHAEELLAEVLGLGEREIARLYDTGVVAGPTPVASWAAEGS